jgi:hypothetical protein
MSMPGTKVPSDTWVVDIRDGSSFMNITQKNKGEYQNMNENEQVKDEQEQVYLDQIADLKKQMDEGMIPKDKYEKLLAEHKKLLNDYVNRRPAPQVQQTQTRSAKEVAKELIKIKNRDITNRDYIAKALEYREAHLKEFGTDPFTDFGQNGPQKPTEDTNMVASTLKTLLEENPSPVDFRIKLNSVLQDDPQLMAKLRKRA